MRDSISIRQRLVGIATALLLVCGPAMVSTDSLEAVPSALAQPLQPGAVPGQHRGASSDAEIWREVRRGLQGSVSIPDKQAGVLVQSEGDNWRAIHNGPLPVYGSWAMLGVIALTALFFLVRGRIRIDGGFSGRLIQRFNSVERFAHWLTASSFVILALSGLNILYGRYVVKPVLGPVLFADLARIGKYLHDYLAFAFMLGLLLILVLWIRDNIPDRYDWIWLAKGGGMFSRHSHPPARKFNAGQKILFWLVILGGLSASLSGIALLFPFHFSMFSDTFKVLDIFGLGLPTDLTALQEMQLSQLWHAAVGLALIAVIIGHIYIGTLGMEGAFDAMGTGQVDENWAREHHSLWVAELKQQPTRPGSDD